MNKIIRVILFLQLASISAQDYYCAGDIVSQEHQIQSFDVCYPEDHPNSNWSLSNYNGELNGGDYSIILIDIAAAWCDPCFNSIDFWDDREQYWSENYPSVKFVTALSSIGEPWTCQEWGDEGLLGTPLIIEDMDDPGISYWFDDSEVYPRYILIDHTMTVRAKVAGYQNTSTSLCDGSDEDLFDWSNGTMSDFIFQLIDECGDDCNPNMLGCMDSDACNYDEDAIADNGNCQYAEENQDCNGNCLIEVDCNGECGGTAIIDENGDCTSNESCCVNTSCFDDEGDPCYYETIQEAIYHASMGDTIIVEQGEYCENLLIEDEIVLASRAIYEDLSCENCFVSKPFDQWTVINENVNNTIINGECKTLGSCDCPPDDYNGDSSINQEDSCELYFPNESTCMGAGFDWIAFDSGTTIIMNDATGLSCGMQPEIFGLTITGGSGTRLSEIFPDNPCPSGAESCPFNRVAGGGLLYNDAFRRHNSPIIQYNKIIDNGCSSADRDNCVESGGGIAEASGTDIDFPSNSSNRQEWEDNFYNLETRNCYDQPPVIPDFSRNYFNNNHADLSGNTVSFMYYSEYDPDPVCSDYDPTNPNDECIQQNRNTWAGIVDLTDSIFDVYDCGSDNVSGAWVDFAGLAMDAELDGSAGDQCTITGDVWVSTLGTDEGNDEGSQGNPFRTITHALQLIQPENNQITIHLEPGEYGYNENFPLTIFHSNISIKGSGFEGSNASIINGNGYSTVVHIAHVDYLENVSTISDVVITGGHGNYERAGGVSIVLGSANIENVSIHDNVGIFGGGISFLAMENWYSPRLYLNNVTISDNHAIRGGGIAIDSKWNPNDFLLTAHNVIFNDNVVDDLLQLYEPVGASILVTSLGGLTKMLLNQTTFYNNINNSSQLLTQSIIIEGGMGNIINSILWDDEPFFIVQNDECINCLHISYNNIYSPDGSSDNNNINVDPLFTDPENADFSLLPLSPCIDAGTDYFEQDGEVILVISEDDYDGFAPDLGAKEFICESSIYDECGICNGDNSSCTDCTGIINGSAIEDCFGICEGEALLDECGVCNGDNSNCLDCNGEINGTSIIGTLGECCETSELDECGVCNGDGNSCSCDLDACLFISNVSMDAESLSGFFDVILSSSVAIGGVQMQFFNESQTESLNITSISGGILEEFDYTISFGGNSMFAFSFTGIDIPETTYGLLFSVTFEVDSEISEICFGTDTSCDHAAPNVIASSNGSCVDTNWGDCQEIQLGCSVDLGDVNGDATINILDLVQISYYILEFSTLSHECAADFNNDDQVDILDLVQIVNVILF